MGREPSNEFFLSSLLLENCDDLKPSLAFMFQEMDSTKNYLPYSLRKKQ
jgi:hypothetical protein